jgi:simple sugar transport system ATP-binding protein
MGLSIIFISHKLHEVMGVADRCNVLRHGRAVGTADTHAIDTGKRAALMVEGELSLPRAEARAAGPRLPA